MKFKELREQLLAAREELEKQGNPMPDAMAMSEKSDIGINRTASPQNPDEVSERTEHVIKGSNNPKAADCVNEKDEASQTKFAKTNEFETVKFAKNGQWSLEKKHIGFKPLQHKLEDEGHGEKSAARIAASIGRKKYGAHEMSEMAHKSEGTNEEAASKKPHNKDGHGEVMPLAPEKEQKHVSVKGLPYDGREVGKSDKIEYTGIDKNEKTNIVQRRPGRDQEHDAQRDQNKGRVSGFGL